MKDLALNKKTRMGSSLLLQGLPSVYIQASEIILIVTGLLLGFMEFKNINFNYSKFNRQGSSSPQISSRTGMLIFYAPAFLVACFYLFCKLGWPHASILLQKLGFLQLSITWQLQMEASTRLLVLTVAVALHFFKRVVEVLFIHRYSGRIAIGTAIFISFVYSFEAVSFFYVMQISEGSPLPTMDLMPLGILLFVIGMGGNLYHHYLLSRLRKDGKKGYSIPHGGLFEFVVCPHYLFEIIDFVGLAFISQTSFGFCTATMIFLYLLGRSLSTRAWYVKKFEGFPSDRKALIPFVI
uniref:3-oxo-5-alpha-steroid 4-dehydrogenase C-terminal domain-containing protein n=1 Tax=Picea sitchensis TaxID=3332 RepID=D5A9X1_PICSI|nr:unknown [Picea sitchensis]